MLTAGLAWCLCVGVGLRALHSYESTPGAPGRPAGVWPEGSVVRFDPSRINLVMLAHPRCPCTRASVEGLASLLSGARDGLVTAHVLFYRPGGADASWGETETRRRAAAIPGVRALDDPDGAGAARFGARTSGHVVVYDPAGRLLYSGGLTEARGKLGDSPGKATLTSLLTNPAESRPRAGGSCPTFGCSIKDDETAKGRWLSSTAR